MIVRGQAGDRYPWEPITLAQQLARTAAAHPDRDALVFEERRLTWAQTQREVTRVARALRAAGVQRGDHVAVWVPNHIEWILLWLGANSIGAVIVAVNTRYKTEEVEFILRQSDAKLLVMVDEFVGIDYLAMLARLRDADLPELRGVVVIGEAPRDTQSWTSFLEAGDPAVEIDVDAIAYDDPSFIVYTSGTTGYPKGAVHSSRVLRNECSISEAMDIDASSRVMNHMPFFHIAGACTGVLPPLITGGAMILMERWDPAHAFELIERERVTVLSGIPTHFIDLLNHDALDTADVSSLKTGWIGGANNPPEVIGAIVERLGMKGILPVYGMTETTSITTIPKLDDPPELIGSGKGLPVSDFELKVVDAVSGAELDFDVEGEVCVRGHLVMQGYYENDEATHAVIDDDGWFHTGDLGVFDANGYLAITGRKSDMFIVGGSNAYPAEIERALSEHPAIKQAYVVGVPHPRLGEVGFAFVELRRDAELDHAGVTEFCKGRLADFKVPRHIEFVTEWPLTATGKIQRFLLRERAETETHPSEVTR
jgi:fatty-acyl-CoA synthase